MPAQLFNCPSCGAPVIPRGKAAVLNCPYCHASVVVPEELRRATGSANWGTLVYDGFVSNHNDWLVGEHSSEYFAPVTQAITNGRYRWEARVNKASSIVTSWLTGHPVTDFHLLANCKHIRGSRAESSWGVIYRIQDRHNFCYFRITDNRLFSVTVQQNGEWKPLVDWTNSNAIKPDGVNQLEVIAQGKRLAFLINGQVVNELDDSHFDGGLVGLAVEGYKVGEEITYDFLDILLRAP